MDFKIDNYILQSAPKPVGAYLSIQRTIDRLFGRFLWYRKLTKDCWWTHGDSWTRTPVRIPNGETLIVNYLEIEDWGPKPDSGRVLREW